MQEAARIARKLSVLADMGLEKVEATPVATEACRVDRRTLKVNSARPAMGTLVSVTALHRSQDRIEEAIGRAFDEMDRLIGILSRFESSSAVSLLNRDGRLADVPPEVSRVFSRALSYHGASRGAFDITVQPLVDLFRASLQAESPAEPGVDQVRDALTRVGSQNIAMSRRSIRFERDGMGVTLDGIAKGYIVDAVAAVLERDGVKNYLINAGGDIRASGTKEDKEPWTVAVQDPAKRGDFPDLVHLKNGAVATSGSYEIYFDRERAFHHIVDSGTGRSPSRKASVTVVAPSAMAADALATAAFVMDPGGGVAFIDSLSRCECLIVDTHGCQLKSKRWRSAAHPT
jgi:thiamine biosynthesis lipoprotein